MNTKVTGRIYHVVDKTTGEVIKVGSTIQTLAQRFRKHDYRKKYTNHFLREARSFESSDLDEYRPEDSHCPFLWHLVAAEHLEILRMGTYRKTRFSNQRWPLDQKFCGFDGTEHCFIGGINAGRIAVASKQIFELGKEHGRKRKIEGTGIFAPGMAIKGGQIQGKVQGRKNVESGLLMSVCSNGGKIGGRVLFETKRGLFGMSEREKKIAQIAGGSAACKLRTPEQQAYSGRMGAHIRHRNRGILFSDNCKICSKEV